MKKIDVLYTANKQYIDIMLSSIISLILNANLNDLTIHIIASGFEKNDFHKIEKILNKYGQVDLEFYQLEQFDIDKYNIPNWRGSQIANARLFFQDILNCALKDNISDLPLNYNMYPSEFIFNQFLGKIYFNDKLRNIGYEEVQKAKTAPKIIHSCRMTSIKPWSNNKVNPFTEEYMKYIKAANSNFIPEELNSNQKFFNMNQSLLNLYLILITYMPSRAQSIINKLSLIMQNNPSQQKREVKKYVKK